MPTIRLFDDNAYETDFDAKIIDKKAENGQIWVCLDRTCFFPEGGGQYPDIGTINSVKVSDVQEDSSGNIWHCVENDLKDDNVHGIIDFSRRFDFMQQHSGEHIFSGIAHELFGATNVGFHLGLEYTTIDLDVQLSEGDINLIEEKANTAIYKNVPFLISYPGQEELKAIPYRSKKELFGKVRIVTIPGYDICACCGTHVRSAGEIGIIKIVSFQNYKGGTRLTLLCGKRAYLDFREKTHDINAVTVGLSVKPNELCTAVSRLTHEITDRKIKESQLRNEMFSLKADLLGNGKITVQYEKDLTPDETRIFSLSLSKNFDVAIVFSENSGTWKYAVSSSKLNCNDYARLINENFSGRGGGKPELCMGSCCANRNELELFFDKIISQEETK